MLYEVLDENGSHYVDDNAAGHTDPEAIGRGAAEAEAARAHAPPLPAAHNDDHAGMGEGGAEGGESADASVAAPPAEEDESAESEGDAAPPGDAASAEVAAGDEEQQEELQEELEESNLMHSINGYVYGNMPVPRMRVGERVRWYVFALGTEVDMHTPHWHGNTVLAHGVRTDVVDLLPATMLEADMVPDAPGLWQVHCHVNDHIAAGMQALYRVSEA